MNLSQFETDAIYSDLAQSAFAVSQALSGCELHMYNRVLHTHVTHICKVLRFQYAGLNRRIVDVTNALSGGWREANSILKDGGKLSCKVHIPDTPEGRTLRGVLASAMFDQSLEKFDFVFRDGSGFSLEGFVFVAHDIRLSAAITRVDIEVTGEVTAIGGSL